MTISTPAFLVVTTLQRKSGIERDSVVNTWHFDAPSGNPTPTDFGNWANNYTAFMDALAVNMSPVLSGGANHVKVEYWKLPPARGPLGAPYTALTTQWLGGQHASGYPAEVACCLSLDAVDIGDPEHGTGGTRPAQRKRNRKYLGPLGAVGTVLASTFELAVSTAFRELLTSAFKTHMVDAQMAQGWKPLVHSRTDWAVHGLQDIHVDDAFDTQRRRGNDPLVKTSVPTPGVAVARGTDLNPFGLRNATVT